MEIWPLWSDANSTKKNYHLRKYASRQSTLGRYIHRIYRIEPNLHIFQAVLYPGDLANFAGSAIIFFIAALIIQWFDQIVALRRRTWLLVFLHRVSKYPANIRHDEDVLKTSFVFVFRRRLDQDQNIRLVHTSSRRFQDVLQRCLQDVFKKYRQVKLFLLTRFQDVFETFKTFLRRTATAVIYRRICPGHTSEKRMVRKQNLQGW